MPPPPIDSANNDNSSAKKRKKKKKKRSKKNSVDADVVGAPEKSGKAIQDEKAARKSQAHVDEGGDRQSSKKKMIVSGSGNQHDHPNDKPQQRLFKDENPLLAAHQEFMRTKCTQQERDNFFSNAFMDPDRRAELWMEQFEVGESLVNQYAWAIPDARAIRILQHFSPLVEIGCGANAYWARLLATQAGVDIVAFDMFPDQGGKISAATAAHNGKDKHNKKRKRQATGDATFQVRKGGPEVLATKEIREEDRTLFLCYCDEEQIEQQPAPSDDDDNENKKKMTSLGMECLRHYTGDYVIHVGELFGDTTSMEQAPWGRSSSAAFQQCLAATFHCLLRASLPNWIHARDTISVWKRSETCSIVFAADSDDDEDEEGDTEVEYRHIPVSERLPTDIAAPCLSHLLQPDTDDIMDSTEAATKREASQKQKHRKTPPKAASSNRGLVENDGKNSSDDDNSNTRQSNTGAKNKKEEMMSDDEDEYEVEW